MIVGRKFVLQSSIYGILIGYVNVEDQNTIEILTMNINDYSRFFEKPYVEILFNKNSDIFTMISQYKEDDILSMTFEDAIDHFLNLNENQLSGIKSEYKTSGLISASSFVDQLIQAFFIHLINNKIFITNLEEADCETILTDLIID